MRQPHPGLRRRARRHRPPRATPTTPRRSPRSTPSRASSTAPTTSPRWPRPTPTTPAAPPTAATSAAAPEGTYVHGVRRRRLGPARRRGRRAGRRPNFGYHLILVRSRGVADLRGRRRTSSPPRSTANPEQLLSAELARVAKDTDVTVDGRFGAFDEATGQITAPAGAAAAVHHDHRPSTRWRRRPPSRARTMADRPRVVIVGLGPGGPDLLTAGTLAAIAAAPGPLPAHPPPPGGRGRGRRHHLRRRLRGGRHHRRRVPGDRRAPGRRRQRARRGALRRARLAAGGRAHRRAAARRRPGRGRGAAGAVVPRPGLGAARHRPGRRRACASSTATASPSRRRGSAARCSWPSATAPTCSPT